MAGVAEELKSLQVEAQTLELEKSKLQEQIVKKTLRQQEINTRLNELTLEAVKGLKTSNLLVPDAKGPIMR